LPTVWAEFFRDGPRGGTHPARALGKKKKTRGKMADARAGAKEVHANACTTETNKHFQREGVERHFNYFILMESWPANGYSISRIPWGGLLPLLANTKTRGVL